MSLVHSNSLGGRGKGRRSTYHVFRRVLRLPGLRGTGGGGRGWSLMEADEEAPIEESFSLTCSALSTSSRAAAARVAAFFIWAPESLIFCEFRKGGDACRVTLARTGRTGFAVYMPLAFLEADERTIFRRFSSGWTCSCSCSSA